MASSPPPEPLSLDDVKLNLRVDTDAEDALLEALIVTAREHIEDYTGLVLVPREVVETLPSLGPSIVLTSWPVASADDIEIGYYDRSGDKQTIDPSLWFAIMDARPVRLRPKQSGWGIVSGLDQIRNCWGARRHMDLPFPTVITVQAGFATPDEIPAVVKQAMHLLVAHFYVNREAAEVGQRAAAIELPFGVAALLRRWRKRSI